MFEEAGLSRVFKVREFATLAGVTIKALHHYDRLGLLKPARTDAGYRVYSERDLETLEQIVALKFLGIPLKQMYRDAQAELGEDPGSEKAQALVERWFELSRRAWYGDPEVQTDSPAAWMDRANWPAALKERSAELHMEEVSLFMRQAHLNLTRTTHSLCACPSARNTSVRARGTN